MSILTLETLIDDHVQVQLNGKVVPYLERVVIDIGVDKPNTVTLYTRENEDGKVKVFPDESGSEGLTNVIVQQLDIDQVGIVVSTYDQPDR